ncbi:MAG: amino acid permease [Chloroflexi bacterium]|nr:amino acid permease [Chloroflexota bacterium]
MAVNVRRLLLGKRLQTDDLPHQSISKKVGLAVFASDALSSTAYATEEILVILSLAVGGGAGAWAGRDGQIFGLSIPIAIAIAVLLAIVTISYRQTIYAYPNGGGAYIVAKDNLGEIPAQVAGAALLTDYILTVAVSISSGVAQITSVFPALLPFRVEIAVAVIVLLTVVNLRGVKESGRVFAVPTYFFLGMMFLTLIVGLVRFLTGSLSPVTGVIEMQHEVIEPLGLFLILKAFSSGCTALTGIEAISNGISAFKQPRSQNAAKTLAVMSTILISLFLGITLMANQIHALPSDTETVISQMGRAIYGQNSIFYLLLQAGTALILLMAGNTSYADFPRLASLVAADGFLPRQLTFRGGRLVFSWGIVALAGLAIVLVVIADARTTALIPLYAIGVFLSFSISQAGMVIHTRHVGKLKPGETIQGLETTLEYDRHWKTKVVISAIGAVSTFIVMLVFAITKFSSGAWFVVLLVPTLVLIFFRIHRHYKEVAHALSTGASSTQVDLVTRPVLTLILVDDVHAETVRMVNFAKSLGHPWRAVHIGINPGKIDVVQEKWKKRVGEGELVIIPSPYRLLAEPLRDYILEVQEQTPGSFVHVIMGHLVMDTYWEQALHQNSALLFTLALSRLERVVVTSVPYQIHHHLDEQGHDELVAGEASQETESAKLSP